MAMIRDIMKDCMDEVLTLNIIVLSYRLQLMNESLVAADIMFIEIIVVASWSINDL